MVCVFVLQSLVMFSLSLCQFLTVSTVSGGQCFILKLTTNHHHPHLFGFMCMQHLHDCSCDNPAIQSELFIVCVCV